MKRGITIVFLLSIIIPGFSQQSRFSLATDLSVLRSFKKQQRYWSIGQTVTGHFHITAKEGAYILLSYYTNGKFDNSLIAVAKSGTTTPQQMSYINHAKMNFKQVSIGWKHYVKGSFNEERWGVYYLAGFGLMLGRVENTHSVPIDSASYTLPVPAGKANFKRLTMDLGVGYEKQLGGDVFFYTEGRVLIPTTDYPSNYLFVNNDAPFTASFNLGLRILF